MFLKRLVPLVAFITVFFTVPVSADAGPQFYAKTERPAYDANIDRINVSIYNASGQEAAYGMEFSLERYENSAYVPVTPIKEVAVPSLAAIFPADATNREVIYLDPYEKPLQPGRYRIVKQIGGVKTNAEFNILNPKLCMKLEKPKSISVTIAKDGKAGKFTVGPDESPDYVTELWHELLAFQKGTMPDAIAGPVVTITLEGKQKASLGLYQASGKIWAKTGESWYFTEDAGFMQRLEAKAQELGAFLPSTGTDLINSLNALPPLKNVRFTAHDFTKPFQLSGWRSDRKTSGVTLSIFQFPSAEAVNRQMNYLYEDGYTLGIESRVGSGSSQAVSFGRQRFDWSDPPHYFKAGSRLVLYNGSDSAILSALTGLLGPEVEAEG